MFPFKQDCQFRFMFYMISVITQNSLDEQHEQEAAVQTDQGRYLYISSQKWGYHEEAFTNHYSHIIELPVSHKTNNSKCIERTPVLFPAKINTGVQTQHTRGGQCQWFYLHGNHSCLHHVSKASYGGVDVLCENQKKPLNSHKSQIPHQYAEMSAWNQTWNTSTSRECVYQG